MWSGLGLNRFRETNRWRVRLPVSKWRALAGSSPEPFPFQNGNCQTNDGRCHAVRSTAALPCLAGEGLFWLFLLFAVVLGLIQMSAGLTVIGLPLVIGVVGFVLCAFKKRG